MNEVQNEGAKGTNGEFWCFKSKILYMLNGTFFFVFLVILNQILAPYLFIWFLYSAELSKKVQIRVNFFVFFFRKK